MTKDTKDKIVRDLAVSDFNPLYGYKVCKMCGGLPKECSVKCLGYRARKLVKKA